MTNNEPLSAEEFSRRAQFFRDKFHQVFTEVSKAIVGHDDMTRDCLISIFSQGHVLLEGVPGLGKTYLVKVLARVLGLTFGRVQCTPDLMPADILGTHIIGEDDNGRRVLRFEKGPVFHHLLLIDEINRATPKTQSALLEVMQEHAVTAGGETFPMPSPFFVLATQNPLEMEGTYPLPEAQLDRFFFKLRVPFPGMADLVEISRRTTGGSEPVLEKVLTGEDLIECQKLALQVPVADSLTHYAATLILASHPKSNLAIAQVNRYVNYGASPRGLQALIRAAKVHCLMDSRTAVSVADIQRAALPALRHRILLNFEGEAENVDVDQIVRDILAKHSSVEATNMPEAKAA